MIGVLKASSFLMNAEEGVMGVSSSEGNVPDPGVGTDDAVLVLALLSYPAAAIVADDVAVAMVGCRHLREWVVTEESNE